DLDPARRHGTCDHVSVGEGELDGPVRAEPQAAPDAARQHRIHRPGVDQKAQAHGLTAPAALTRALTKETPTGPRLTIAVAGGPAPRDAFDRSIPPAGRPGGCSRASSSTRRR